MLTAALDRAYYRLRRGSLARKKRRMGILGKGIANSLAQSPGQSEVASLSAIFRVLDRTGNTPLKTLPRAWWAGYFHIMTTKNRERAELQLSNVTETLPVPLLSVTAWLELYRLCLLSGLFRVGLQIREKAEAGWVQAEAPTDLNCRFAVQLEHGDWSAARESLAIIELAGTAPERLAQGRWLIDLLSGAAIQPFAGWPQPSPVEAAFLEQLQHKSLALVGPVPSSHPSGHEIDRHDLVAKFNYRGGVGGLNPETQGERIDIAYYNIEQSKYIAKHTAPGFLRDLRFPVFIKDKGLRLLGRFNEASRLLRSLQWLLLDSEFNAGPNAVFDLLRFAPSGLQIFNQDLMLTAGRFPGYVQPNAREVNYCFLFAETHDPVIQFRFLQHAWKAGLIQGDSAFAEVMAMSLPAFIDKLQLAHGEIGREAINPKLRRFGA